MSLFSSFRKPAWQSSNPEKRLAAVATGDDPALRAVLPAIAREDPEVAVRREALRRCDDPALYAHALQHDADSGIRVWARERWLAALAEGRCEADGAALDRLEAQELETLAVRHPDSAVRRRLLQRISRPGFIAERALADPDAGIRLALLERIGSVPALERIAERARRSDKRLARAARERADALRLASGDALAQIRRAEALCQALEQLMREPMEPAQRREHLQRHEAEWQTLDAGVVTDELKNRFAGTREVILTLLDPPPPPSAVDEAPAAEPAPEPPPPSLEEIAAQTRVQAELAALAEEQARERALAEAQRQEEAARRAEQHRLLEELARALGAGEMAPADAALSRLQPEHLGPADQRRWRVLQPRLRELRDWQRWAARNARRRLCSEVEALEGRGLHPDAIASRVHELQQQWREIRGGQPGDALERRFHAACARVLKPARPFFEKRDALRAEHRQALEAFLGDAEEALATLPTPEPAEMEEGVSAGAGMDTGRLLELQTRATTWLRQLDRLAPGDRREAVRRLRTLLDRIRAPLEARFEEIQRQRERLVEAATRLVGETDGRRLAAEARALTRRWQALGKGRRSRDQEQWRRFRAALDEAFSRLDAARREQQAALDERRRQAEAVIAAIEAAAALDGDELLSSAARVREAREQWRVLAVRDEGLGHRFDEALTRHRLALEALQALRRRQRWLAMVDDAPVAEHGTTEGSSGAMALVFEAEALAGIDPPEEEREARRQWQLRRLQSQLGRGAAGSDMEDVLRRWQALGGVDAGDRRRYGERLRRAIERGA